MAGLWPVAAWGAGEPVTDAAGFQLQLGIAQALVTACAAAADGCVEGAVPADAQIGPPDAPGSFHAGWQWLRDAMRDAHGAPATKRAEAMRVAGAHVRELSAEAGVGTAGTPAGSAEFGAAQRTVRRVLAGDEFQTETGPSWLDRQFARLQGWVLRFFLGVGRVGERNPWLAPAIEWTCFALAAGGLIFFVRRSLQRQALRITLGDAAAAKGADPHSVDWAGLMEKNAAAGAWREAVHAAYWAAILLLERRRAWRPNPTRTPREYLRLLRPESEAQRALRELTTQMERLWYGHGEASEAELRRAREVLRVIEAADLGRTGAAERAAGAAPAVGTA